MLTIKIDEQYFKNRTTLNPTTGCWEWNRSTGLGIRNYGQVDKAFEGVHYRKAHRLAFAYFKYHPSLFALHTCDNPPCCNPDHLFEGTINDNNLDKILKGRSVGAVGARNGRAKLTDKDVRAIRSAANVTQQRLADHYGVSQSLISHIQVGRNWKHVQ